jgi:hypothetical protein
VGFEASYSPAAAPAGTVAVVAAVAEFGYLTLVSANRALILSSTYRLRCLAS